MHYRVHYKARNQEKAKEEKCLLQLVVPKALQYEVVMTEHNQLHVSFIKVWHGLMEKYWWPGMLKSIKEYRQGCEDCQRAKTGAHRKASLDPIEAAYPWQIVYVDITEPHVISNSGNRYLLVFIDLFSKYCEAFPLRDMKAETVAKVFYEKVIMRHGPPERFLSERGHNFLSEVMKVTREIFHVKGSFTASYRPQCNGACEAMNKYLTKYLSFLVSPDQKDWNIQLPTALYYCNNAPSDRKTDYTPFYLLYGRYGRSPLSFKLPSINKIPAHVQDYVTNLVNKLAEALKK